MENSMFTMRIVGSVAVVKRNGKVIRCFTDALVAMAYRDAMNAMRKEGLA